MPIEFLIVIRAQALSNWGKAERFKPGPIDRIWSEDWEMGPDGILARPFQQWRTCGEPAISLHSDHVSLVQWTTRLLPIMRDPGSMLFAITVEGGPRK